MEKEEVGALEPNVHDNIKVNFSADAILECSHPKQEFKLLDEKFEGQLEYKVRYSGIMGHVHIDEMIYNIFHKRLKDAEENFFTNWFNWTNFRRRVGLSYIEGIIDKEQLKLLEKIIEVRNACAHRPWVGTLTYEGKDLMNEENLKEFQDDVIKI